MNTKSVAVQLCCMLGTGMLAGCNSEASKVAPQSQQHAHREKLPESGNGHGDHGKHGNHDAAAELIVRTEPSKPEAGKTTKLTLMVHSAMGKMISEFEETHTKLAHLIVVRKGLDEFAHLHPDVDAQGNLTVDYEFPQGGKYKLFLDHKPRGGTASTANAELSVSGNSPEVSKLVANVPGEVLVNGLQAKVTLKQDGKSTVVAFDLRADADKPLADLRPYLGAMGHLVVISADGEQYAHSHPLTDEPGTSRVEFEVHFPAAGLYKMWGQFQRQDEIITVPAVVHFKVGEHAH